jgi:hypothetical protein
LVRQLGDGSQRFNVGSQQTIHYKSPKKLQLIFLIAPFGEFEIVDSKAKLFILKFEEEGYETAGVPNDLPTQITPVSKCSSENL